MLMKNFHIGLLPRIIIAIILGILFGNFLPASLVRLFVTFNAIFSEFLNFSIPLIIVGLVTIAIADIGKGAGRMLVVTALIAYGATLFSGFLSYFTGMAVFPSLIETGVPLEEVSESQGILPYFSVGIPPLMNVMTALVLAFTLGLGLAHLKSEVLKNAARDFQEIVIRMISAVILPLLPIYIFGIFLNMTHSGQVFGILMVFIKIIGVIFLLHIFLLVFQYSIAALFVRKNPLKLLGRMMPAYFTALGTQSSAATIPVTLEQSRKNGVSADIAGFVIPLCATIHLSGSTLKIVACALALMIMQGMPHDFPLFAGFIFMLGITMVAAPGYLGGAIMASLGHPAIHAGLRRVGTSADDCTIHSDGQLRYCLQCDGRRGNRTDYRQSDGKEIVYNFAISWKITNIAVRKDIITRSIHYEESPYLRHYRAGRLVPCRIPPAERI